MQRPEFTLTDLLLNNTGRNLSHTAIVDGQSSYTYQDLYRQTVVLAQALKEYGVSKGDRVGVYLDKRWEAVVAMFAVAQAGGVFVNMTPLLKESQASHIMKDCDIKVLISESSRLDSLNLPPVRVTFLHGEGSPNKTWCGERVSLSDVLSCIALGFPGTEAIETDLATIIYTSGSTGVPKGIMVSHRNLVAGAQIVSTYLENSSEDRVLSVLPFSFDYGLNQLTTMVRVGGTLVLQRSLLSGEILRNLRKEAITGLAGIPPVWALLLQNHESLQKEPLSHLRYITNSGGTVSTTHLQQLRSLLPATKIYLMYGLTEAFRSTYLQPKEIGRGPMCIGKAIPNTEVWVLKENGQHCSPGEVGELVHRGPTVSMGYWNDEAKTRAVFRVNPLSPKGMPQPEHVVYSGDYVKQDEQGFLYFVGRKDEQIKTAGYRVSPQEVEDLLCSVPAVQEAAVFGQKDSVMGQKIVAVVSLKPGTHCTAEEILENCRSKAPHYLVPKFVHILNEMPRVATGKIDRGVLRHDYARD